MTIPVCVLLFSCPETVPLTEPVNIGDAFQGGIVAYILQAGDTGYNASVQHGIIATTANLSETAPWALEANQSNNLPSTYGTAIGTGQSNTTAIVTQNGAGTGYAAGLCEAYTNPDTGTGIYSDWYLPSIDELIKLLEKSEIINLPDYGYDGQEEGPPSIIYYYWSSTSTTNTNAKALYRGDDSIQEPEKGAVLYIRPIRSF